MSEEVREPCGLCTVKHLGQARALLLETRKGYPFHIWYAMGHLAEAEDEILAASKETCEAIREVRLKLQNEGGASMDGLSTIEIVRIVDLLDPLFVMAAKAAMLV